MDIQTLVNEVVDRRMKNGDFLKHTRGKVISFDDDYFKIVVDINGKNITVVNKSGCKLEVGNEVTIYYWTNVGNGYIAYVNGKTTPQGGGFSIEKAVVMTENQATAYTYVDEIINVDVTNNIQVKYGNGQNTFFVNGHPVVASHLFTEGAAQNPQDYIDLANRVYSSSPNLIMGSADLFVDSGTEIKSCNCNLGGVVVDNNGQDVWLWQPHISNLANFNNYIFYNSNGQSVTGATSTGVVGYILISGQIMPPDDTFTYGYAICTALPFIYGSDILNTSPNVHIGMPVRNMARTHNLAFKNQIEYDYALTTLTKSEINPSN